MLHTFSQADSKVSQAHSFPLSVFSDRNNHSEGMHIIMRSANTEGISVGLFNKGTSLFGVCVCSCITHANFQGSFQVLCGSRGSERVLSTALNVSVSCLG